ncbi:MAG: SPOR domain-containing protein [Cytophagaceae bacterium]
MNRYSYFIYGVMLVLSFSCAAQKNKNHATQNYKEDLSQVRPTWEENVNNSNSNQNTNTNASANFPATTEDDAVVLNKKLDSIAANRTLQEISGYRILVYSGTSSDESSKVRKQIYQYDPNLSVYTDFKQPTFRVKVGNFTDRVQANYILNDLRKQFPNAMIVPDMIMPAK